MSQLPGVGASQLIGTEPDREWVRHCRRDDETVVLPQVDVAEWQLVEWAEGDAPLAAGGEQRQGIGGVLHGLELVGILEEPQAERHQGGAEHADVLQAAADGGRLDVDEIQIAQILPRCRREELARGGWRVIVSEVPYLIQEGKLYQQLGELVDSKKAPLLGDVRDELWRRVAHIERILPSHLGLTERQVDASEVAAMGFIQVADDGRDCTRHSRIEPHSLAESGSSEDAVLNHFTHGYCAGCIPLIPLLEVAT